MRWREFEAVAPELARFGAERLRAAPSYLATVSAAGAPRVHPVTPILGGGSLFVFMEPTSPKGRDLRERGTYALHSGVPDNAGTGGEFFVSGRATAITDAAARQVAVEASTYAPADRYVLFELGVDRATMTVYEAGGPKRTRWAADDAAESGAIAAVDHVQLAMPPGEERRAVEFYSGLLGIPEVPKPPNLAKRGGCWFERGPLKVHLGVEQDFRPAKKAHPALRVRDLASLVTRLRGAGVDIVDDEPLEGYDRVYVSDPFGNRIELLEPRRTP